LIPQAYIQAWRKHAPWPNPAQVEQDLIICRALCDLFNAPALAGNIAFRGGMAIHKLLFKRPMRCSEDNDLAQTQAEPIRGLRGAVCPGICGGDRVEHAKLRRFLAWRCSQAAQHAKRVHGLGMTGDGFSAARMDAHSPAGGRVMVDHM
jgi:hypothetical protein